LEPCKPIRAEYPLLIMKTIDFKSLLIGGLLISTIFFGFAGGGGVPGGAVPRQIDPVTGLPLSSGGRKQIDPTTGLPIGRGAPGLPGMGGGLPGMGGGLPGMGGGLPGMGMPWNPNQVWEVKSYSVIAGKPQPEKGLMVQGYEPFAVDGRGNIMFRRQVR
jgi:hypothetical protein